MAKAAGHTDRHEVLKGYPKGISYRQAHEGRNSGATSRRGSGRTSREYRVKAAMLSPMARIFPSFRGGRHQESGDKLVDEQDRCKRQVIAELPVETDLPERCFRCKEDEKPLPRPAT